MNWITIALLVCLLAVFFQDWKFRKIHVVLPLLIFVASSLLVAAEPIALAKIIAMNLIFFTLTFGILVAYMSVREKRFRNPFEHYFGIGDVFFYVAITPLFLLQDYIFFFVASMVFALLLQFSLQKMMRHKTVPLAGFAALLLMLLVFTEDLIPIPRFTLL